MNPIQLRKTEGRILTQIHFADERWSSYSCSAKIPGSKFLFNFEFTVGRGKKARTFLVLDPYGDERLPSRVVDRFFGQGTSKDGFTLAIEKGTGFIYRVHFMTEKRKVTAVVAKLGESPFELPETYRKRVDELRNKKRPFHISCPDYLLWSFIEREASFNDLQTSLVVELQFDGYRLQLQAGSYREVGDWESMPEDL